MGLVLLWNRMRLINKEKEKDSFLQGSETVPEPSLDGAKWHVKTKSGKAQMNKISSGKRVQFSKFQQSFHSLPSCASEWGKNRNLQNLLVLTAIKADKHGPWRAIWELDELEIGLQRPPIFNHSLAMLFLPWHKSGDLRDQSGHPATWCRASRARVMDYINRLDNYDGPEIAKIAGSSIMGHAWLVVGLQVSPTYFFHLSQTCLLLEEVVCEGFRFVRHKPCHHSPRNSLDSP